MSPSSVIFLLVIVAVFGNITIANKAREHESPQELPPTRRSLTALVDCYSCVSCPDVTNKTTIKTCPYNPNVLKVKKCVKFAEKVPDKDVSWVIRGCVSEKGTCEEMKKAYHMNPDIDLDYCIECDGDKCNGVSRSVSEVYLAFFSIVLVPIFGKFILS